MTSPKNSQHEPPDARHGDDAPPSDDLPQDFSPIIDRLAADGESWQAVLPSGTWLAQLARLLPGEAPASQLESQQPGEPEEQTARLPSTERHPGHGGVFNLNRLREQSHN